jgi:hypothetical protein
MNNDMLLSNKMQLLEIYYLITKDILRCYISIDTNIKAKKIIKDIIKMF